MSDRIYDVCIIGSGAGSGPIAYELSNAGYDVLVLEKGKYFNEDDFSKDELAILRRDIYTPLLSQQQHVIIQKDQKTGKKTRYEGAKDSWSFWNGSLVGGSSNLMSGFFARLKPNDFKLLSTFGEIAGANVVDWPISYEDLEPFYAKVESVIGVSGKVVKHKFQEPRSTKDFPYEPLVEHISARWIDEACKKLNLESIPLPRAILSTSSLGRNQCSYSNYCGSFPCATAAKGSSRAALLQKCKAQVITDAFVYKIHSDKKRVTKLSYYTSDKKSFDVKAKLFILAAQAHESQRLLLNSKNKYFPKGLANNNNQVGKNLIFSAGGGGGGTIYLKDLPKEQAQEFMQMGVFTNRTVHSFYEYESYGKKIKGGSIDFLMHHSNVATNAISHIYDDDGNLQWGEKLKNSIFSNATSKRDIRFEVFNDWLPTDDCFMSVDDKVRDIYGLPVGQINLYSHKRDLEVGRHITDRAVEILKAMGAKDIYHSVSQDPPPNLIAGGARFGNQKQTSVLDKYCKTWELDNLFISDASFMPTGGSVPYTFSIYANSFRIADYILKNKNTFLA